MFNECLRYEQVTLIDCEWLQIFAWLGNKMKITIEINGKIETFAGNWENRTLLEAFQELGITQVHAPCGGIGTCKKCLVNVNGENVLSCQTMCEDGMMVVLEAEQKAVIAETGDCYLYPADQTNRLVAACDIGTTTVVCHLLDGKTGVRLGTVSAPNAQRSFGADVISRIQAAKGSGLRKMQFAIMNQINQMIGELMQKAKQVGKVDLLAVAGNTVMEHLFCGLSPESIGVVPFEPLSKFGTMMQGSRIGINRCNYVYMIPAVAGYVGGDIVADLIAAKMHTMTSRTLLLDIGTNGEMVLGTVGGYVCCATAAGPAFEGAEITMGMPAATGAISEVWAKNEQICVSVIGGGKPTGICGSGLIDTLAVCIQLGLMDETGLLLSASEVPEPWKRYVGEDENGVCICLTDEVRVTQADVRKIQLAKAPIAAGIQILLQEKDWKIKDIDQVILAGGFGSYMRKESAAEIGLIPKELVKCTHSVGNAAGEGAVSAALASEARTELEQLQKQIRYVELSTHEAFSDIFIREMSFTNSYMRSE